MSTVTALPVNSVAPADWWRRVSTSVNTMLGLLADLYQRPLTAVTADYAIASTDYALIVNASSGAVSLTLPAATQGRELIVKRIDSTSNAVTLSGQLDGATSTTLEGQWKALRLIGGKDRWYTA